jgi:hypothetical protein
MSNVPFFASFSPPVEPALEQVGGFDASQPFKRRLARFARVHVRADLRLPGQLEPLVQELTEFVEQRAHVKDHGCSPSDRRS